MTDPLEFLGLQAAVMGHPRTGRPNPPKRRMSEREFAGARRRPTLDQRAIDPRKRDRRCFVYAHQMVRGGYQIPSAVVKEAESDSPVVISC